MFHVVHSSVAVVLFNYVYGSGRQEKVTNNVLNETDT